MTDFLAQGDRTMPTVFADEITIGGVDHELDNFARGIRNGSDEAVNVEVTFVHGGNHVYKNIQPGATEICQISHIIAAGTTATAIEVLY